jgi:ribosomal subunit interface protein
MEISFSFKNFSEQEKAALENYLTQKLPALEKAVTRYSHPPHSLELRAERFVKKSAYNVTLHLKTSRGVLMASEDDHTIVEAVDLAKDKLVRQLTRK